VGVESIFQATPVGWFVGGLQALFGWVGGKRNKKFVAAHTFGPDARAARWDAKNPARAAQQQQVEERVPDFPPFWAIRKPHRRRTRAPSVDGRTIVRGTNGTWQEKAKARRTTYRRVPTSQRAPDVRRTFPGRAYSPSPLGSLVMGIGDVWLRSEFQRLDELGRRRHILATNRRGAAAAGAFEPRGNTNRTGANASPGFKPQPQPQPQPQRAPATAPARNTGTVARPAPAPVQRPAPVLRPASVPRPAANTSMLRWITPSISWPRPGATVRTSFPTTTAQTFAPPQSLTALNLGMVTLPQPQPVPQEELDKCKCPKPKKKAKDEKRCKNPVVSRTVKDGIRTTKVRLQCPSSKAKSQLLPRPPTTTSLRGVLSSIPGVGSFSPWG